MMQVNPSCRILGPKAIPNVVALSRVPRRKFLAVAGTGPIAARSGGVGSARHVPSCSPTNLKARPHRLLRPRCVRFRPPGALSSKS